VRTPERRIRIVSMGNRSRVALAFLPVTFAFLSFALALLVVALALPLAAAGLPARAASIHPSLRARIEGCRADCAALVWVFFNDHGFATPEEQKLALARAQDRIGPAALARRSRAGAARAGDADLPVAPAYREAIGRFGAIRHESRWLNAVSARVPLGRIEELARLPFVASVRPVRRGRTMGIVPIERGSRTGGMVGLPAPGADEPYGPSKDQLLKIGAVPAHEHGYTGAGVRIMMIDTGFRKRHEVFRGTRLLAERDFIAGDDNTANEPGEDPEQHVHGTITWSACGGHAPGKLVGAAYGASYLLAKTESVQAEMPWEEDTYIAALEWGDSLGVDVTSASLAFLNYDDGSGYAYEQLDGNTAPVTRAIDRAAARGILCVNAIGNSGPASGTLVAPADADSVLACGAITVYGAIAGFSSRGPTVDGRLKPEVVAPGVDVWCADAAGDETYGQASGTSLATPLVAGACALLLEAHPEWSAMQARAALMQTADGAGHPDNIYGNGCVDVWRAIQSAPVIVPTPFSLVSPADGESIRAVGPTFCWHRSFDPQGGAVTFEIWLDEQADFSSPILYSGLKDTIFTLPDRLPPLTRLRWRVIAEEPDGYRRVSREDWICRTRALPDSTQAPVSAQGWGLEAAPNPWRPGSVLRWHAPSGSRGQVARFMVLDPAGRRLVGRTLAVSHEGWEELDWDPRSTGGTELPSGVYLGVIQSRDEAVHAKIVLVR